MVSMLKRQAVQAKAAALPPEPPADESATTACLIRLPDGSRFQRRFRLTDPLPALFNFIDSQVCCEHTLVAPVKRSVRRLIKLFEHSKVHGQSAPVMGISHCSA